MSTAMRRLLVYTVLTLLTSVLLVSGDDCPTYCKCDTTGTSGIFAKCSTFDDTQQFGIEIAYLDLSNIPESSGLKLTDRIFANAGLKHVSSITIVNSALKVIDVNAFHGLHNLNQLNLGGNHLGLLEPDMLANNTHLEKLTLSRNPLENMQVENSPYNEYFLNIPSLQDLDLSRCSLSHLLPTMFKKLTTVTYVNLASNNISDIPKETFAPLLELDDLDLSDNKLSWLRSDMFENNSEMNSLNMQNNYLSSLRHVKIESLQKFDLSLNKFTAVDVDTFAGFPNIRNLNLSGNAIISINSNAFKNMIKLQNLDLSNNKLTGPLYDDIFINNIQLETLKLANNPEMKSFPETGFQGEFSEIYMLDASRCGLTHLEEDDLKSMNHIQRLYLHGNEIQYIKRGVLSPNIIFLDLSGNKIAHLDQVSFPSGSSLRTLHLSGNPIKKISPAYFVNTSKLRSLSLKSCELKQLWDSNGLAFQPLKFLTYLNVANNKIKNISPKHLNYTKHVETLVLSGNPLTCNDDLKELIRLLTEKDVASSDATTKKQSEEMKIKGAVDTVAVEYELGWNSFLNHICQEEQSLTNPISKLDDSRKGVTHRKPISDEASMKIISLEPPSDHIEMVTSTERIAFITTSAPYSEHVTYFPEDIHKDPVTHTKVNYMWPIIIVCLSAFSIILALVILAALLLRWTRQKNSYRSKIARRHSICRTPRSRRGSTLYQQLYEDPNTPTTPVMMSKVHEHASEQQTFTFPDKDTNETTTTSVQSISKASYLSSPFHHSNIVPESV
jgi:Leucine-rich repeat (LRR) protein